MFDQTKLLRVSLRIGHKGSLEITRTVPLMSYFYCYLRIVLSAGLLAWLDGKVCSTLRLI